MSLLDVTLLRPPSIHGLGWVGGAGLSSSECDKFCDVKVPEAGVVIACVFTNNFPGVSDCYYSAFAGNRGPVSWYFLMRVPSARSMIVSRPSMGPAII